MKTRGCLLAFGCLLLFACGERVHDAADAASPEGAAVTVIAPGAGRTVLVVSPHADDAALFIGGTIAAWADAGWRVVVARVTDDRYDSVGISEAETIAISAAEFRRAMEILGVAEAIDLGLQTDVLADVSEVSLRERIIRLIRRYRPYAIVTIDPYSGVSEDNQDHVVVAEATAEAVWTSQFDKHHPEHFAEGLKVHGVVERWFFGRPVREVTDVVDITATLDRKIEAALAHETPLRNIVHQLRLQARTAGYTVAALEAAQTGDLEALIDGLVGGPARTLGARYGLGAAEAFRVVRFGGLMEWLEANGEPIDSRDRPGSVHEGGR